MKKETKRLILWGAVAILVIGAGIGLLILTSNPGKYDTFAQCLKDKGAVFYGAFWCPNCQNQKALFRGSSRLLPYVECSTPDRQQTPECREKKVEGYPTWDFADGSRTVGTQSLEQLAQKTACELPK